MANTLNFCSIADLNQTIFRNISKIPQTIDLIVGIPRSGMLPANLIALYMNKPYTDIDSFIDGRIYGCGFRGTYIKQGEIKNILIVDDSICSGSAMKKAKAKLQDMPYNMIYCAIYACPNNTDQVDIFCEIVSTPRVFQWNMFHHKYILSKTCCDIDGVLCNDTLPEQNDDGPKYKDFLLNAQAKFIPSVPIKTLISCRLEKYRSLTETWLKTHGIIYEHLILLNMPDAISRRKWGKYGDYKAAEYNRSNYLFFIESSLNEAKRIKEITKKPVFCIQINSIL